MRLARFASLLVWSSRVIALEPESSVPTELLSQESLSQEEKAETKDPSWFDQDQLTPCGLNLIQLLKEADSQGLKSSLYEPLLRNLLKDPKSKTISQWNALLNQALRHYLSWAMGLRKNLSSFDTTTHLNPQPFRETEVEKLVCSQDPSQIEKIGPQHPQAVHLKRLLAFYLEKKKEGGWPTLPVDFKIASGQAHANVLLLKKQLEAQGYPLEESAADPIVFHEGLQKALRLFQLEHSLDPSGRLTPETIKELNKSVAERIDQVRLNLERWRWLPLSFQGRSLIVNIPTYHLTLLEGETAVKEMSIIVGKTTSQTPSFATYLSVITLNPSWSVPYSIATQEKLPLFRRNPQRALAYKITSNQTGEAVSPSQINWDQVSKGYFPYHLSLAPSSHNPLGPIKFTIPNPFSIYMHGTSNPKLFQKATRAFSWGCIRISDPFLVGEFIMNSPQWTQESLQKAAASKKTQTLRPAQKVSVYLTYFTLWMGEDGRPRFAGDVYHKDPQILSTLDRQLTLSAAPFQDAEKGSSLLDGDGFS